MKLFLALMISLLTWSSCRLNVSSTNATGNIPIELETQMRGFEAQFFESITREDMEEIKGFLSDALISSSNPESLLEYFLMISSPLKESECSHLEQFEVKNSMPEEQTTLLLSKQEAKIQFVALNTHSFVSILLTDEVHDGGERTMFFIVYGKYPEGWKVNIINTGVYSFANHTAIDFFAQAKAAYEKGHLVDAALYINRCEVHRKPVQYWVYNQDEQMSSLKEVISAAVNEDFTFPFPVDLASQPVILGMQLVADSLGLFPFIEYETQIAIKEDALVTKENDEMHHKIGQIFKGLNQNERIFYRAYEAGNHKNSYGFMKKKGDN